MSAWQPSLPGLTLPGDAAPTSGLVAAATTTLRVLDDKGLLRPEDALTVQLVLDLAAAVAAGVQSKRASAVALAARELREAMALLPQTEAPTGPDTFEALAQMLATVE